MREEKPRKHRSLYDYLFDRFFEYVILFFPYNNITSSPKRFNLILDLLDMILLFSVMSYILSL